MPIIIPPRIRPIAEGFNVTRVLPYAKKRTLGPFIFWDHMGPVTLTPNNPMAVGAHPHIGLSTLTYLFTGQALHRDSLGNECTINPGDVNWMTAGKGIAHSERTQNTEPMLLEGLQLWLALPKALEHCPPAFQHVNKHDLPTVSLAKQLFTLIAGEWENETSPVNVHSPCALLAGELPAQQTVVLNAPSHFEMGLYIANGEVTVNGQVLNSGHMAAFEAGEEITFSTQTHSKVFILGGPALPEPRYFWWNFVSTSKDDIEAAKIAWQNNEFAPVINESERLPLPEY